MIKSILLIVVGIATVLFLFAAPALYNSYRQQANEQPSLLGPLQGGQLTESYHDGESGDHDESWIQKHVFEIEFSVLGLAGIACGVLFCLWAAERRVRTSGVGGAAGKRSRITGRRTTTAHRETSSHVQLRHRRRSQRRFSNRWVVISSALMMLLAIAVIAAVVLVIFEPGTGATGTTSYSLPEASSERQLTPAETEQNRHDVEELIRRSKEGHPTKYF